jgi:hypothetical protein
MDPRTFEVFCSNLECGDPQVYPGGLMPLESRKHRRMNYMGKASKLRAVLSEQPLERHGTSIIGTYHRYQCPVCGRERIFWQFLGGSLSEVR